MKRSFKKSLAAAVKNTTEAPTTDNAKPTFSVEEVESMVRETIELMIGAHDYSHAKVTSWTNAIIESALVTLTKQQKPFKYIVTCVIMQRTGAGLHLASSCYWDASADGKCTIRWENDTITCIVTVFGLAI